jgi:hypothetical protein
MRHTTSLGHKFRYGRHELAAVYRSRLKKSVQLSGETLRELAAAVELLAHSALVSLHADIAQRQAAYAVIDVVRNWEVT